MTNRQLKKARQEFLDEMVSFYSADPVDRRSINAGNTCYYRHPDGVRKCSIGRYIPDDKYDPDMEDRNVFVFINNEPSLVKFNNVLPVEIQNLSGFFLRKIQYLHDDDKSWDIEGLTCYGLTAKKNIEEEYINNLPDDDNEVQGRGSHQETNGQ